MEIELSITVASIDGNGVLDGVSKRHFVRMDCVFSASLSTRRYDDPAKSVGFTFGAGILPAILIVQAGSPHHKKLTFCRSVGEGEFEKILDKMLGIVGKSFVEQSKTENREGWAMIRKSLLGLVLLSLPGVAAVAQESVGLVEAVSTYKTITVDGNVEDWAGIEAACTDATGDGGAYYDFAAAYVANDKDNIYIRLSFSEPQPYGNYFWYMNIAFDTDWDTSTGHGWSVNFGSEFCLQGRQIFDQRCGDWVCTIDPQSADNNWGTFAYASVEPISEENCKDIEISISRDLVYKNMDDGQPGLSNPDESPLFDPAYDNFVILFETEDENYQSAEWMPNPDPATNDGGVLYFFAAPPAELPAWEMY